MSKVLASRQSRRRCSLRGGLVAMVLAPFLSLGLVIAGPLQPAHAFTEGAIWSKMDDVAKGAAPVRMFASASPVGLAINAGIFAFIAYQERDTWMPIVEDLWSGTFGAEGTQTVPSAVCGWNSSATPSGQGFIVSVQATGTGCGGGHKVIMSSTSCKNLDTGEVTGGAQGTWWPSGVGSTNYSAGTTNTSQPNNLLACPGANQKATGGVLVSQFYNTQNGTVFAERTHRIVHGLDPDDVSITTDVDCKKPDGTIATISATEDRHGNRLPVPSCEQAHPGSIPWQITTRGGPKVDGAPKVTVGTLTTDEDVFEQYGDCFGPTGLECQLKVYVDGQPCVYGQGDCPWWTQIETDRVECRFGTHVVPLEDCQHLRRAYAGTATLDKVDTSGEPSVEPVPETFPPTRPDPNPNPDPTPTPTPSPTPTPEPGTEVVPRTGTNPTTPGTTPGGTTDPDSTNCWGEGWSWNPVSWVYVPVKCSFLWAFKPSPGYLDLKFGTLRAQWSATTPALWLDALSSIGVGDVSGCSGLPLDVEIGPVSVHERIGAACSGFMADAAQLVRIGLSAVVVVCGGLACVRALGSGFGWSPGVGGGGAAT